MSVEIIRVVGESFDLRTGQDLPKGVVLFNGRREVFLLVNDAQLSTILDLWSDLVAADEPSKNGKPTSAVGTDRHGHQVGPVDPATFETGDDDLEPGESYEDSLTGAASI